MGYAIAHFGSDFCSRIISIMSPLDESPNTVIAIFERISGISFRIRPEAKDLCGTPYRLNSCPALLSRLFCPLP